MNIDRYKLLVYWGNREEIAEDCAERCAQMIRQLAKLDAVFGQWYQQAMSRKAANKPFCTMPPQGNELARIFDKGRQYLGHPKLKDQPHRVLPEAGMSISAWNGMDSPHGMALSINAGGFGEERRRYPNYVFLDLPEKRLTTGAWWRGSELRDVLLGVVEPWMADYAVIVGKHFAETIPCKENGHYIWPYAGWLTYLASPLSEELAPPAGVIAERFADGAQLVTLCDEPCDPENAAHMALADAMHRSMQPVQQRANSV